MKIVCLERATLAPEIHVRRPRFPHDWVDHDRTRPEQVVDRLAGAPIAVVNKVRIGAEALAALPQLKLIAVAATGTDNLDLAACQRQGVTVSNVRGYATTTVPEHVMALVLALRRQIVGYRADVAAGGWQKAQQFTFFNHPISDLRGSRMGIVGGGAIGQAVAALARAFGMEVVFSTQKGGPDRPHYVSFEQVVETADVLTLHCPLTPTTRGMIGRDVLRRMKRSAILINTARGPLIDDAALTEALRHTWIAGAGIDVTMPEPPPADHPLMRLLDLPNFILTPHTAWASRQAMQTLADQLIDNIEAFVDGAPRNVVTP
jgi:glycerate dehydrogenase